MQLKVKKGSNWTSDRSIGLMKCTRTFAEQHIRSVMSCLLSGASTSVSVRRSLLDCCHSLELRRFLFQSNRVSAARARAQCVASTAGCIASIRLQLVRGQWFLLVQCALELHSLRSDSIFYVASDRWLFHRSVIVIGDRSVVRSLINGRCGRLHYTIKSLTTNSAQ